jgi:hypothetical protein
MTNLPTRLFAAASPQTLRFPLQAVAQMAVYYYIRVAGQLNSGEELADDDGLRGG